MTYNFLKSNKFVKGLFLAIASLIFLSLINIGLPGTIVLYVCTLKGDKLVKYLLSIIDSFLNVVGQFLYYFAITLDLMANAMFGQILELIVTDKRRTTFGSGKVTISASLGLLEKYGYLNLYGIWLSRTLNLFFNEKSHCIDSWELYKLKKLYFKGIEKLK